MSSSKEFFDIAVVIPLEEELTAFLDAFPPKENRTDGSNLAYVVSGSDGPRIIVFHQTAMGKSAASNAVHWAASKYDIGIFICIGIAGALDTDLSLCDVCYSGTIIDVYDNASAEEHGNGTELKFSPNSYDTPKSVAVAMNFLRIMPEMREAYESWQLEQTDLAERKCPDPVPGRAGKNELIQIPKSLNGTIVCGAVSKSPDYNKKLKALDRKVIAVETESGGIFEAAKQYDAPCLTIRGISDYADGGKSRLEGVTKGNVRSVAAMNAVTFFRCQLGNERFLEAISDHQKGLFHSRSATPTSSRTIAEVLSDIEEQITSHLRSTIAEYSLTNKGYRLPLPRVRLRENEFTDDRPDYQPRTHVRDAIVAARVTQFYVPRTYPDDSLPWIIAQDLLTFVDDNKQTVPILIDGNAIRGASSTLRSLAHGIDLAELETNPSCQITFVIENVPFQSRHRLNQLKAEIDAHKTARFVIVSREDADIINDADFSSELSVREYDVCDIAFIELAHFVEKHFSKDANEADVIATRLHQIFNRFQLSAHPSYIAGIPSEVLAALLKANQRAELLQLAVDGFLLFSVAEDDVPLTRTTRLHILRSLAVEINVQKRTFTEADLVSYIDDIAKEYDYPVDPLSLVNSFVEKGIIGKKDDRIAFMLPFMETYVLADALSRDDDMALSYFALHQDHIDLTTFDIYVEKGPSSKLVQEYTAQARLALVDYDRDAEHVLLRTDIKPRYFEKEERRRAMQRMVKDAIKDANEGADQRSRKQEFIDLAEHVRDEAVKSRQPERSEKVDRQDGSEEAYMRALDLWQIGTVLLGSGSERLTAVQKDEIADLVIQLAAYGIDGWTRSRLAIDFDKVRIRLTDNDSIADIRREVKTDTDPDRLREMVDALIDIIEYAMLSDPFGRILHRLCENVRSPIIKTTIEKVKPATVPEQLIHALWYQDVDVRAGKAQFLRCMERIPPSVFVRTGIVGHMITRAFWSHSSKWAKLELLNRADEVMKGMDRSITNKAELKRALEKSVPSAIEGKGGEGA